SSREPSPSAPRVATELLASRESVDGPAGLRHGGAHGGGRDQAPGWLHRLAGEGGSLRGARGGGPDLADRQAEDRRGPAPAGAGEGLRAPRRQGLRDGRGRGTLASRAARSPRPGGSPPGPADRGGGGRARRGGGSVKKASLCA